MNDYETTYSELLKAAVCQGATIKQILSDLETLKKLKTIAIKNRNIKGDMTI